MHKLVTRLNKGFTLIELMVVVAIVGILLAVGLPSYSSYVLKSRMLSVVKILEPFIDQAREAYVSSGTIPTTVNGIPSGTATASTISTYVDYIYYDDGSSWANAGQAAMVQAIVSSTLGNSITGFSAGPSGQYNRITLAFVVNNGSLQVICGNWQNGSTDIPSQYLPSGCEAVDFASTITG